MVSVSEKYILPTGFTQKNPLDQNDYQALYQRSIKDPTAFWEEQAHQFISWIKPWKKAVSGDFKTLDIKWFESGKLNACYNCVDRHLKTRKNKVALIWEGNNPSESKTMTYGELHNAVCKFANVLKKLGIKKGDRICIYLPMIPEAMIAMLACARIGAIHSVVFAGFSADALKTRLLDANCCLLITADEGIRGEKTIPLKKNSDLALQESPNVKQVIVVKQTGHVIPWNDKQDLWYHEAMQEAPTDCPIEPMDAHDPLFILYTSGSTGKPKGILHSTGGYLVYAAMTHYYIFDYHEKDIHWCTADVGWITGHTYAVYGPLANGATTVFFEGVPHYPDYARFWQVIDKHQVTIFYTAPTAIRALRHAGDALVKTSSRKSLRLLGTVGEPINPSVWEWYYEVVGEKRCPIVDTWWQTETGGILLTALPSVTPLLPGSVGWPFFGILPKVVNEQGEPVKDGQPGALVIEQPWPGLMQTIYGNPERFFNAYFKPVPGVYFTGDSAYRDEAGYFTILGRQDDVIKVSGHRLGTGELESALLTHATVSEAAVVGIPDELTGESIYAFITLKASASPTEVLKKELIQHVRTKIGAITTIKTIQWAPGLPKTRSGKIMRRVLRKIACGEFHDLGDLSTLAEVHIIDDLIADKIKANTLNPT